MESNNKHLRLRAGFGLSPGQEMQKHDLNAWMNSSIKNRPIGLVEKTTVDQSAGKPSDKVKQAIIRSRQEILKLNGCWMNQLTDPSLVVREKMTLFWHDHFACRVRFPYLAQQQNNLLRQYSLGKFGDLVNAVSKDPGMLQFLNNQQNRKNSPNENFARELLELFTLGRGHYSEDDIRNSARAFTGWSFNPISGKFLFREKVHDDGIKAFKGKKGAFNGEDILQIILEDKQTALFITEKIWRYFVSEEKIDFEIIRVLAERFYASDYDIEKLLFEIFSSTWFYESRFIGNRIKSPVELLAGIMVQTGGRFEHPEAPVFLQRALNQILFFPPNVGGWPSGTGWIDSSSLTFRLSLASVIMKNSHTNIEAKDDGDVNNATNFARAKSLTFLTDWGKLADEFVRSSAEESLAAVEQYLLSRPAMEASKKVVRTYVRTGTNDPDFIRKAFIGFMSLPEYQLS
jgi:uncharacterized protein (DUF1800 family)